MKSAHQQLNLSNNSFQSKSKQTNVSQSKSFLVFLRYILNSDGTIKSDDESRVSIKCTTLACLSYLSTIDPFAFFDSFDYPTEGTFLSKRKPVYYLLRLLVIIYLLFLREHGDPHLRGACANLLAKLIQTTVRLLTISPPISSLTNSFNNSFINQCSLISNESQESSRLGSKHFQLPFLFMDCTSFSLFNRYSIRHSCRITVNISIMLERQQCTCYSRGTECSTHIITRFINE